MTGQVQGSVVNVRRWVSKGETPRVQVRAHQIAAPVVEGTAAATPRGEKLHATLPGAVGLDGSIALADSDSSVLAAGVGRGCCQYGSSEGHAGGCAGEGHQASGLLGTHGL